MIFRIKCTDFFVNIIEIYMCINEIILTIIILYYILSNLNLIVRNCFQIITDTILKNNLSLLEL